MTSVASARLSSSPYASGYSSSGSSEATSSCTSNYQSEQQSRRGLKRSNRYSGSQTYASDANAVSSSLGSGGYRADLSTAALSSAASEAAAAQSPSNNDAATSLPPNIAYLIRKNNISNFKQSTTSSSDEAAAVSSDPSVVKRQKTCAAAEMNHRLRTIRQDMERGGLKYPTQRKARVFPPKSFVDMSGVSLVSASSLLSEELNPFLFPKFSAVEAKTKNGGQYMECPLEIASLVQATSCFYQQPSAGIEQLPPAFSLALQKIQQQQQFVADQRRVELEKSASSASSSDGESDNSVSSFTASDGSGVREVAPHQRKTASSKPNVLPINEALSISRHPRIIALAQSPYKVVQVNAAFLRLTKSTSTADFLGKPLNELTTSKDAGSRLVSALKESLTALHSVAVPGDALHFSQQQQDENKDVYDKCYVQNHSTTVFPVGSPGENVKVTHFAIKLRHGRAAASDTQSCVSSASSSNSSAVAAGDCETITSPLFVMG